MIKHCPNCGCRLPQALINGISSCNNCELVFASDRRNELLAAAWTAKKQSINCSLQLVEVVGLSLEDADFLISNRECSHQEFCEVLKKYLG